MRNTLRAVVTLCALALAAPAAAQGRPSFGMGVSIVPLDAAGVLLPIEVYVPIRIGPQLRLEPSLGIWTRDEDGIGATDTSDLTLGLGVFFMKQLAPAADMYLGGRVKLNFASVDTGVVDDSDTDLVLAAAVGGEYYLVPQLSLGAEGQLGFYDRGDVSGNDSGFFTTGLAFLRVYF